MWIRADRKARSEDRALRLDSALHIHVGNGLQAVPRICATFVFLALLFPAPARAELAYFQSGRTLSIKEHHADGASLVLTLRNGGQIVCEPSVIARFAPDEVPYPEPEPAPVAAAVVPPAVDPINGYSAIIDKVAAEQGVPAKLVHALIRVESGYQERARSPKGAMGLMQLMPETAKQYGLANPYDPVANIEAGIRHLRSLMQRLPLALALAAYNAGEAAVARFHGIPPYPETQAYVGRILKLIAQ
jgi:soluble lytic murein transglycosylase-like protein